MHDAVDFIHWFAVRSGVRSLEAAALVDSHVNEHGAGLHKLEHVLSDEVRSLVARDEHRADNEVGGRQLGADIIFA